MRFRHYDNLRTFAIVAHHGSISSATNELHLTKGAISQQIKVLEQDLGFALFDRVARGIKLTKKGQQLFDTARNAFASIDAEIESSRDQRLRVVTLGVSTYLASRWLSPHLMSFLQSHPDIRLRVQPMIDLFDLQRDGIDLAIRWGKGDWNDLSIEPLFNCPAFAVANADFTHKVGEHGLAKALSSATLLHDRDNSIAWQEWFTTAGIPFTAQMQTLTIPDPNVRVQAVIDGQGIALNDRMIERELKNNELYRIADIELSEYGYYLASPATASLNEDVAMLMDWLREIAKAE